MGQQRGRDQAGMTAARRTTMAVAQRITGVLSNPDNQCISLQARRRAPSVKGRAALRGQRSSGLFEGMKVDEAGPKMADDSSTIEVGNMRACKNPVRCTPPFSSNPSLASRFAVYTSIHCWCA